MFKPTGSNCFITLGSIRFIADYSSDTQNVRSIGTKGTAGGAKWHRAGWIVLYARKNRFELTDGTAHNGVTSSISLFPFSRTWVTATSFFSLWWTEVTWETRPFSVALPPQIESSLRSLWASRWYLLMETFRFCDILESIQSPGSLGMWRSDRNANQ